MNESINPIHLFYINKSAKSFLFLKKSHFMLECGFFNNGEFESESRN